MAVPKDHDVSVPECPNAFDFFRQEATGTSSVLFFRHQIDIFEFILSAHGALKARFNEPSENERACARSARSRREDRN